MFLCAYIIEAIAQFSCLDLDTFKQSSWYGLHFAIFLFHMQYFPYASFFSFLKYTAVSIKPLEVGNYFKLGIASHDSLQ